MSAQPQTQLWCVTALVEMHSSGRPEIRVPHGTVRARAILAWTGEMRLLRESETGRAPRLAVPAQMALTEMAVFEEDRRAIHAIFEAVSSRFGISLDVLQAQHGQRRQVLARHLCFYLIRKLTGLSLAEAARQLGHHHTSLMHGIAKIERMAAANVCFRDQCEELAKEARRRLVAINKKPPERQRA